MSPEEWPLSTDGATFQAFAEDALSAGTPLVVLLRYANAAGSKDFFLVRNQDELVAAREFAAPMDSLSLFPLGRNAIVGQAGPALQSVAVTKLSRLHADWDDDPVLDIVDLDPLGVRLTTHEMDFVQATDELSEWMVDNLGRTIALLHIDVDNDEGLTAYVPGPDGVVRLGAY